MIRFLSFPCLAVIAFSTLQYDVSVRRHSPLHMATESTSLRTITSSSPSSSPSRTANPLLSFPATTLVDLSNSLTPLVSLSFPPLRSLLAHSNTNSNSRSHFETEKLQQHTQPTAPQLPIALNGRTNQQQQPLKGYGASISLTKEEQELFRLLQAVKQETGLSTTLRVAGGWVRDKLLATPEFQAYHYVFGSTCTAQPSTTNYRTGAANHRPQQQRLTTKFQRPAASLGRQGTKVLLANINATAMQQPVDIDIALDDMLGRQFAEHLNRYLPTIGEQTVSIGMVLQNPQKSKHLETATLRVNQFWLDLVNLRAEQYAQGSRIPDSMRIGTALEDAYRRDLTINALFYNIETGQIEDWTGRGFADLRKGIVATPLPALTTLLDDPLRILRSIRFAARLRFTMSDELTQAAQTPQVVKALTQKVSRERVGGEFDLMIRSPDPVGAVRLLVNLGLAECVFPTAKYYQQQLSRSSKQSSKQQRQHHTQTNQQQNIIHAATIRARSAMLRGLHLLGTSHDYVADCRWSPPLWCQTKAISDEMRLIDDEESRRLLWYAALLKPIHDDFKHAKSSSETTHTRQDNRSVVKKVLVDDLKRPVRDAEAIDSILHAADEFAALLRSGCDVSATMILLSDIRVRRIDDGKGDSPLSIRNVCAMNGRTLRCGDDEDPIWIHAMEFRYQCSKVLKRIGWLWRAAMILAVTTELDTVNAELDYAIEGDTLYEQQAEERDGILERYDVFAAALQNVGLIGNWDEKPLIDGKKIQEILPSIPKGPAFRDVMEEQTKWMALNPCCSSNVLVRHLQGRFPEYAVESIHR